MLIDRSNTYISNTVKLPQADAALVQVSPFGISQKVTDR